jgi:Trypsin-like peptidase domain
MWSLRSSPLSASVSSRNSGSLRILQHRAPSLAFGSLLFVALLALGGFYVSRPDNPSDDRSIAAASAVRVRSFGCGFVPHEGMGVSVGHHLVLTDAHIVAGGTRFEMQRGTKRVSAHLVHLDTNLDLALVQEDLSSVSVLGPALLFGTAKRNETGWITVFRNEATEVQKAQVLRPVNLETEDIYIEGKVHRAGYELQATTRPGDSGSAVVVRGRVVGLLWSRSRNQNDRAWLTDVVPFAPIVGSPSQWSVPSQKHCV